MKEIMTMMVIILVLCCSVGYGISPNDHPAEPAIGKSNPFEGIQKETRSVHTDPEGKIPPVNPEIEKPVLWVETVMLKHLRAISVSKAVTGLNSPFGSITVDEPTNSLILCDKRDVLDKMLQEIRKADQTPRQILVEVVVADVKYDNSNEIGVNWENLLGDPTHTNWQSKQTMIRELGSNVLLPGGYIGYSDGNVNITLHMLKKNREVEVLASPKILVLSGQEATIKTVEEIPYVELTQSTGGVGSQDALTSTKFKEVGVTLKVKATITDEGKILIDLSPQQSINTGIAGVGGSTVPIVDTRSVQTSLLLDDNQLVVIGGLRRTETRISQDKVPFLGDIPILGYLFSTTKREELHAELLIILCPHIDKGNPPSTEEISKYKGYQQYDLSHK